MLRKTTDNIKITAAKDTPNDKYSNKFSISVIDRGYQNFISKLINNLPKSALPPTFGGIQT